MALRHWLQLALTEGIGPILTQRLIETAGGAEAACAANQALLRQVEGIGSAKSQGIFDSLRRSAGVVDEELRRCQAVGVNLIAVDDASYPVLLKAIPDPPPVLYLRGHFEPRDLNAVGIVGSRRCSHYGHEQAERFGALLAGAGVTVVSGGARGIDSASHRGALAHVDGRTVAILGCGVDVVYPPENEGLFHQIAQRGAVVSEFPLGSPPLKENFPRRNRIISGLSRGILVVEADLVSGALITARQACDDHGRPVFALPGRVDNRLSDGPHALIRDGAVLVTQLTDILDNLGPLPQQATVADLAADTPSAAITPPPPAPSAAIIAPSPRQQLILNSMGDDPADVDGIISRSDLAAEIVLQELTMMTLKGMVKRVDGQHYVRRA